MLLDLTLVALGLRKANLGDGAVLGTGLVLSPIIGGAGYLLWVASRSSESPGHPSRLASALVGVFALVYALASLSGRWLGTPFWWVRCMTVDEVQASVPPLLRYDDEIGGVIVTGREWISASVAAVGFGLAFVAAWPRRRRPNASPQDAP